jgi:DNA-binding NarL/FixJ family response regulator
MHGVTTLVVDDQPVLRYAVRQLLRDYAGVRAVAEAGTEREALRQCEKTNPDMVITELSISGEPAGAGICQFAKEHLEQAAVLVFAGDSSPGAVAMALNAGADSFVHKSASGTRLMAAVRSTLAGGRVWVPAGETAPLLTGSVPYTSVMTKREEDILALMLCRWSARSVIRSVPWTTSTRSTGCCAGVARNRALTRSATSLAAASSWSFRRSMASRATSGSTGA